MAKTARKVVVMVMVGLAGITPAAAGAEPESSEMRILVVNRAGVPSPDVLVRAQAETARIYAAVGVKLVWTDPPSSFFRLTMMIARSSNLSLTKGAADAMGAAPAADEGTGRLAYAFYDRIEAAAQQHRTDAAKILGHVMAHELGHILLVRASHTSEGLMNGRWGEFEMGLVAANLLMFTKAQATLIRNSVDNMNATHGTIPGR